MAEQAELTVMVYFASDNPLAPLVVSEIKAIKDAGFQQHTNVLLYFDPMEKNVPTQLYDVNRKRKELFRERAKLGPALSADKIGDGPDPFVRNMAEDLIDASKLPPQMAGALNSSAKAEDSLTSFVEFGIREFPATNFMLFLVGHGMIVGNDAFLPDNDPVSAISLTQMKTILTRFVKDGKTRLQLLALHSCSMSSIEVAYELRGLSNYMIATQGITFVNSWPFRQLMKKILNQVKRVKNAARKRANGVDEELEVNNAHLDIPALVESIYFLCLFNATDFMAAGYSADFALCTLDQQIVENTKGHIQNLVGLMKDHLTPRISLIKDLILLAHWESQSYFSENYTDLFDFCQCLSRRCDDQAMVMDEKNPAVATELRSLSTKCEAVMAAMVSEDRAKRLVIHSEHFGSQFQYSHGLSIYFPWHSPDVDVPGEGEPVDKEARPPRASRRVLNEYQDYEFTTDFDPELSWLSFLKSYFENTRRPSRIKEDGLENMFAGLRETGFENERVVNLIRVAEDVARSGAALAGKRTPEEGTRTPDESSACDCPTIKNHAQEFSITAGALRAFEDSSPEDQENDDG